MTLRIQEFVSLRELTTLGVGGSARYFAIVENKQGLQEALHFSKMRNLAFFVIGKGSNILLDEGVFPGLVILNKIEFLEEKKPGLFFAGGGYSFSLLGTKTARAGYSGLEFAAGIPGSVGGAVFMNAGAAGKEVADTLVAVEVMDALGNVREIPRKDLKFSYRTSPFQQTNEIVCNATFSLQKRSEARGEQVDLITYRKKTQPYGDKSAGCFFRNPECAHAGALIEKAGLKGFQIGGAKVSELHANFIVNVGGATTHDILSLKERVQKEVYRTTGQKLEVEVRYISFPL